MSRSAPTPAPPRGLPRVPPGTTPAPPLDTPTANPDERVTVTFHSVGATWTLFSSAKAHRIVRDAPTGKSQVTEYPADSWAAAVRFMTGAVERELVAAGSTTRGRDYCGDCGTELHRGACPRHGDVG